MDTAGNRNGSVRQVVQGTVIALVTLGFIVTACVALSGWMNHSVEALWGGAGAQKLGTVGQFFDAGNAVFSGLALILVIGTTVMQRRELAMQRDALSKSHRELHRSAEADLRRLHMDLIKMAIDDPSLADVWGQYRADIAPERRRQYLYANLIFSHLFLQHSLKISTDDEMLGYLKDITKSPIFREYWNEAAPSRAPLLEGSAEHSFGRLVDRAMSGQPDPPDELRVA